MLLLAPHLIDELAISVALARKPRDLSLLLADDSVALKLNARDFVLLMERGLVALALKTGDCVLLRALVYQQPVSTPLSSCFRRRKSTWTRRETTALLACSAVSGNCASELSRAVSIATLRLVDGWRRNSQATSASGGQPTTLPFSLKKYKRIRTGKRRYVASFLISKKPSTTCSTPDNSGNLYSRTFPSYIYLTFLYLQSFLCFRIDEKRAI